MRKCILLLLALLLALPAAALADDTQFIEHDPFFLDDTWVEGSTRPGEYHYYPFTVEQVGLVTVRAQLFCTGRVQLLDEPCAMGAIVRGERHAVGSAVGLAADCHRLGEQGRKALRCGYLLSHEGLLCKRGKEEAGRGDMGLTKAAREAETAAERGFAAV